jgi:4-amino-4-deoxy-L-arabinose transferase-like glycosyltransferase
VTVASSQDPHPAGSHRLPYLALQIALTVSVLALVFLFTESAYLGDTGRYMTEIMNHRAHLFSSGQDPFWDFGHPAWRPLVNVLFDGAGRTIQRVRGGDARQALAWLMIAINIVAMLVAVCFLWLFLKRHTNPLAAWIASAAFLCTNALLDFGRSGSPYVPGLACVIVALWLTQLAAARRSAGAFVPAAFAGLSLGAAVVLWVPFIFSIPAVILYAVFGSEYPARRERLKLAALIVIFCGLSIAVTYSFVIQQRQIRSFASLKSWIGSAQNETAQTDKVKRAVSGIPRSFLDLGDDTLLLKRYVFHDPYTRIGLVQILFAAGTLKVLLFYLYAGAMVWVLWSRPEERRILLLLAVAALSVLIFAVILFEPGGPEKYMPAYPFFFLGAAAALQAGGGAYRTVHWLMAVFLVAVLCAGNIYAKAGGRRTEAYRTFLERKQSLDTEARREDMVAVISFWDPLYRLPALRLLDSQAQPDFWVYDVIEVASTRVFHWRQEFAAQALARWSQGKQVWLSTRLLADTPLPAWKWVEGDTGRVKWSDVRDFFRSLEVRSRVGGADGFVLLTDGPRNEEVLRALYQGALPENRHAER